MKKRNTDGVILAVLLVLVLTLMTGCDRNRQPYDDAVSKMNNGAYEEAEEILIQLRDYQDSATLLATCRQHIAYENAVALYQDGRFTLAAAQLTEMPGFEAADEYLAKCNQEIAYTKAVEHQNAGFYDTAAERFCGAWRFQGRAGAACEMQSRTCLRKRARVAGSKRLHGRLASLCGFGRV